MMINIFLPILPPVKTSQQKRCFVKDGKPIFFHGKEHKTTEDTLVLMLSQTAPEHPYELPIKLTVELTYPWRKTEKKYNLAKGRIPHTSKPDCDNVVKLIQDCLCKALFFKDDKQVYALHVKKYWGDHVGILIHIEEYKD